MANLSHNTKIIINVSDQSSLNQQNIIFGVFMVNKTPTGMKRHCKNYWTRKLL